MGAGLAVLTEVVIGGALIVRGAETGGVFGYTLGICGAAWIAAPGVIMRRRRG